MPHSLTTHLPHPPPCLSSPHLPLISHCPPPLAPASQHRLEQIAAGLWPTPSTSSTSTSPNPITPSPASTPCSPLPHRPLPTPTPSLSPPPPTLTSPSIGADSRSLAHPFYGRPRPPTRLPPPPTHPSPCPHPAPQARADSCRAVAHPFDRRHLHVSHPNVSTSLSLRGSPVLSTGRGVAAGCMQGQRRSSAEGVRSAAGQVWGG